MSPVGGEYGYNQRRPPALPSWVIEQQKATIARPLSLDSRRVAVGAERAYQGLAYNGDLVGQLDGTKEVQDGDLYIGGTNDLLVGSIASPTTIDTNLCIHPCAFVDGYLPSFPGAFADISYGDDSIKAAVYDNIARARYGFQLAPGVVLTKLQFGYTRYDVSNFFEVQVYRITDAGAITSIGSLLNPPISHPAVGTAQILFAETLSGQRYTVSLGLQVNSGAPHPGDGRDCNLMWMKIFYSKSKPARQSV